jgi:uncharacterized protein
MARKADPRLLDLFQDSGRNVQRTALLLRELMSDYPETNGVGAEIVACEHEGDRIAHDILHHLAQQTRRALPEPADVHALTGALDDIVDFAEEAADQLSLYAVEAPMEQAQTMTDVLVAASEQVATSLRGLRNGLDVGPQLVEIHRLENECDRVQRAALAGLFVAGIDPMIVIRWKDIFDTLESAVDACETVANVLEGMVLKRANGH